MSRVGSRKRHGSHSTTSGRLLEQAGSGVEHVVRCGVWIVDLDDFGGMNRVYEAFFPEPRPARATVRADLILGKVEIDCIALVPG